MSGSYDTFARRIVEGGVISDPWIDGEPRFREEPIVLERTQLDAMYRAAEEVTAVYDELCVIVGETPALLDDFFGLTPFQKAMWTASEPLWHGIARADVFVTDEGLSFAELNCDTPTGEAEAVVTSALAAEASTGLVDPNRALGDRFVAMVELLAERLVGEELAGEQAGKRVGFVYPTEFTEDLSMVRLYKRWLEERGHELVLGSPYNLGHGPSGLSLFDQPFSIMLRHYKTDWWGERAGVWNDETIPDTEPLSEALTATLTALLDRRVAIINPFGAVLPQNKRSMAFMWEHIHRFSPRAQEIIERFIPLSSRLETMHGEQLLAEREAWVLKSDYGAEGDEVIVGRAVTDELWRASLAQASRGRWIAQRYFEAKRSASGEVMNHGVFLVAGEASGIYARTSTGPTDDHALSVPVLVREG